MHACGSHRTTCQSGSVLIYESSRHRACCQVPIPTEPLHHLTNPECSAIDETFASHILDITSALCSLLVTVHHVARTPKTM